MRHRWVGWDEPSGDLRFTTGRTEPGADLRFATGRTGSDDGLQVSADAVILALGGASWPRLGSDGAWVPLLEARGARVLPLRPANCGFDVAHPAEGGRQVLGWSDWFCSRFAGTPLKNVALSIDDTGFRGQRGEFVVTATGVEGSLVYAATAAARERIDACGGAIARIDLLPGRSLDAVQAEVARPRGSRSLATHLKSRLGIEGVKSALLHELLPAEVFSDATQLAMAIKSAPLPLVATRPIAEAISSAGGVAFESVTAGLMLDVVPCIGSMPIEQSELSGLSGLRGRSGSSGPSVVAAPGVQGVACAGEMLDWEAPTGGYLLTACMASGRAAAAGVLHFLHSR